MSWVTGLMVFLITWWMVFFCVLPIGVHGQHENPEDMVEGTDPGAPRKAMMPKKLLITTAIAVVVWAAIYLAIDSGFYSFRDAARGDVIS